ncbi:MAG: ATP-binding cassette domain-containing protein, partial [Oscillospiraceae bacterium]
MYNNSFKILKCDNISKNYGGVFAVKSTDIYLSKGEIVGLIGSNGAGKTTLFNILTGYEKQTQGEILINNKKVNFSSPVENVSYGIIRTFQNVRIFSNLSVYDNLLCAKISNSKFKNLIKLKSHFDEINQLLLLANLESFTQEIAENLPFGIMKMVEILRCVLSGCSVLFLDEPGAGMSKKEKEILSELILKLKEKYNLTLMIIEHDIDFI